MTDNSNSDSDDSDSDSNAHAHTPPPPRQLTEDLDRLVEDARSIFLAKNKDDDLQKAAIHASRAAQIARRHHLLTSEEGKRAMALAEESVTGAFQFARHLVMSAEFRDELVEAVGVIQQSLRRSGRPEAVEGEAGEVDEEEEEEEEEEFEQEQQEQGGEKGWMGGLKATVSYQAMSQEQIDHVAHRFVRLVKRAQRKPEIQDSLRFLLQRLRTAFEMGGLHAERIERQMEESEAGRAFMVETQKTKVRTCVCGLLS